MYYSFFYTSFETRIILAQLEEVGNYIASDLVDLVSLCLVSDLDQFIIEELDIPNELKNQPYSITIVQLEDNYAVRVSLETKPSVLMESTLPWSIEANFKIYNETEPLEIPNPALQPELESSSRANSVIWCSKSEDQMTIGLGVMD